MADAHAAALFRLMADAHAAVLFRTDGLNILMGAA
jgi:hypothetical protein